MVMPRMEGAGHEMLSMRAFARRLLPHVPPPRETHGDLLIEVYDNDGRGWRTLAGTPFGLASAVTSELGIPADVAWNEALPASRRPGVARVVKAEFDEIRAEEGSYSATLLAPPAGADMAAWLERAHATLTASGIVVVLTTARSLAAADHERIGRTGWHKINVYALPPVAYRRDIELPRDQVALIAVRAPFETARQFTDDDVAAVAAALRACSTSTLALPPLGDVRWGGAPTNYPFRSLQTHGGMTHARNQLEPVLDLAAGLPLFAGPPLASERAVSTAIAEGALTRPSMQAALSAPTKTLMETLEEPREAQLAQLMAVVRAAVPVQHEDGRVEFVSFHTARQVRREGARAEPRAEQNTLRAARIVETESLETVVSILDLDSGEVKHIEPSELGEIQRELAPQLLDSTQRTIRPQVEPDDVVDLWQEMEAARPQSLANRPLGRPAWGRQTQTAAAGVVALERHGAWLLIGEQGVGKTSVVGTSMWLAGYGRTIVVCPAQVVAEWEEQLAAILPHARVLTVRKPAELAAVPQVRADEQQVVIIPDSQLGMARRRPAAVARQLREENPLGGREKAFRKEDGTIVPPVLACSHCGHIQPGRAKRVQATIPFKTYESGAVPLRSCADCKEQLWQFEAQGGSERTPYCRGCGWHQLKRDGQPLAARAVKYGNCDACGADRSAEGAVAWKMVDTRSWSMSATWKRIGFEADLLVLDEMHRFKSETSLRGVEAGKLMQLSGRVALATATLTDGTAGSLYYLLRRLAPDVRDRYPDANAFTRRYGVREREYEVKERARGGLMRVNEVTNDLPGLHPALLGELLYCASFITREDVMDEPLTLTEYLEAPGLPADEVRLINPEDDAALWERWEQDIFRPAMDIGVARYVYVIAPDGSDEERENAAGVATAAWEEALLLARGDLLLADVPEERRVRLRQVIPSGDSPRDRYVSMVRGLPDEEWLYRHGAGPQAARFAPDTWHWRGEVIHNRRGLPALVLAPAAGDAESVKERRLVEICVAEVAAGRRCLVFVEGTRKRDIAGRVHEQLTRAGLNTELMQSSSGGGPHARKAWIGKRLDEGLEVLVAHPSSVGVGMNLQPFVTTVLYEINASNQSLRQAMGRALRVDQTEEVKHVYMCAAGTRQETELVLQMSRSLAALPIEGRTLGPERLARLIGVSGLDAQERGLKMMDEIRGNALAPALAAMLAEATERVPAVAAERKYIAPPPPKDGTDPARAGQLRRRWREPRPIRATTVAEPVERNAPESGVEQSGRPAAWETANSHREGADNAQLALFAAAFGDEEPEQLAA